MTDRKTAIVAGILFIVATAMGIGAVGMLGPLIGDTDYLVVMSENSGAVRISLFLDLIMASAVVAIGVVLFPILKQKNETLAVGYLVARTIEGLFLALAGVTWLVLANIGQEFVQAGQPEASYFQTLGTLWLNAGTVVFTMGAEITFGITALMLNYVLFRAHLVPRFITIWGFAGGFLLFVLGCLKILGIPVSTIEIAFTAPIALNEMVLAVWLIAKGFNSAKQLK